MSTAYALAAVTAVLRDRLRSRLVEAGVGAVTGSVDVTAVAPDHVNTGTGDASRLNLFLYDVSLNQGWRNVGQPERDSGGRRVSAPPLALDLHYLLTAYGAEPYHAEVLLGHARQTLHADAMLTRRQIREALSPPVPDLTLPDLVAQSQLAEQVEGLRIVPVNVPQEEMSRMWTALQAHFRPTFAFQVSVVLIDNDAPAQSALPVGSVGGTVDPLRRPTIALVRHAADATAPVLADSTIAVTGRDLSGAAVAVRVDGRSATPSSVSDTRLEVDLTTIAPLRAGLLSLQVEHSLPMGSPPTPRPVISSAPAPLLLHPKATFSASVDTSDTVDGVTLNDGTITVGLDPAARRAQHVAVLLSEFGAPAPRPARTYAFSAPAGNGLPPATDSAASVDVPFQAVVSGTYVARVSVDGADSPLVRGADGRYDSPKVVLP